MAQLAIKGHATRGREVIESLEMLGGNNKNRLSGDRENDVYIIDNSYYNEIYCLGAVSNVYRIFTLEEFLEKYPYKVGDKVYYIKYNDEYPSIYVIKGMKWTGATIEYVLHSCGFSALAKDLQPYKEKPMKKINIAEILKDCPKGTKLYSPICGECTLRRVNNDPKYPIIVYATDGPPVHFTADGRYFYTEGTECILFPSKDQRDWSKFHRPFVDGDIITCETYYCKFTALFKNMRNNVSFNYHFRVILKSGDVNYNSFGDFINARFATEEEKQKLFNAIKENGYSWNAETKTFKPKFDVGNWIICNDKYTGIPVKVIEFNGYYSCELNGEVVNLTRNDVHNNFHLWTIQDAKDGDVLFHSDSASNGIFIFKEISQRGPLQKVMCYCDYDSEDGFCHGENHSCCWTDSKILYPATKEQCNLLFQKIKEAGYKWNVDTKTFEKLVELKYRLTEETKEWCGCTLHRIEALKDFGDVKSGDKGGWIEKEENLSQIDNAWVYDNAKIYDNAKVYDNAMVYSNAQIYNNAQIYSNAQIYDNAKVYDNAAVFNNAKVYGDTQVFNNAKVFSNAHVYGSAMIYDNAKVYSNVQVYGSAMIYDDAKVYGYAEVCDKAQVYNSAEICGVVKVYGNAQIYGNALISDYTKISGKAQICGDAQIYGDAEVCGNALVSGDTKVYGDAKIYGYVMISGKAQICYDAKVCQDADYIIFKNWWSSGRYFTWTRSNNKWTVGCFHGSGDELIKKAYSDSELSGREYERVVKYVESILTDEKRHK